MRYLLIVLFTSVLLIPRQLIGAIVIDKNQKDQLIDTLGYIADGYKSNAPKEGSIRLRGRIFREQYAQEGRTIPDGYVISPKWLNYEHIQKGEKRLYWEDRLTMPGHKHYALDDNKNLLTYATNVVRIYPMKNEEASWTNRTHYYGAFYQLSGVRGFETVDLAMRSLIDRIKNDFYEHSDYNISVEASEDGLFTIKSCYGTDTEKWVIDSRKGFGLVELHVLRPSEEFYVEKHCEYEYEQLSSGAWILANAKKDIIEYGVVVKAKLETSQIEEDIEIPDTLFERENLIPEGIYTVDYTYSPPLKYNRGGGVASDKLILDQLIDTPLSRNEIASVHTDGNVGVDEHQSYIQHEREEADVSTETKRPDRKPPRLSRVHVLVVLIIVFLIIGTIFSLRLRQKSKKN